MKMVFSATDAIKKRYSVRTYGKKEVSNEIKEQIINYANSLSNPFGVKINFKLIEKSRSENKEKLGTYGFITGASLYIGATVAKEKSAQEALGYTFEQLILYITSLGLGTCWLGGTFNKTAFSEEIGVKENELFPIVTPVGYPASKQRLAEKLFRRSLNADNRLNNCEIFFNKNFETPLSEKAISDYALPLEMMRLAPSAKNKQPWRVVYSDNAFHFIQLYAHSNNDGSHQEMHRIDMGIAISHFHLTALENNLSGKFQKFDKLSLNIPHGSEYIISWIIG